MSECKCIESLDAESTMIERNTEILTGVLGPSRAFIMTTKKDGKKRGKPIYVRATFCPFCGIKYPPTDKIGRAMEEEVRPS